jgi:Sulfotransferase family
VTVGARSGGPPIGWRSMTANGLHRLPNPIHRWLPEQQRVDLRHWLGRYHPWEAGSDLTPPPVAPDETTGPPDYVGIGVTLGGARWWHGLVTDHPGVSARSDLPGARHFLSHFATEAFGPQQVDTYHRLFPRRPGTITGEWSPSYSSLPWVVPLLARAAPEARLIMIVRDPVERLRLALALGRERRRSQVGTALADVVDRGFYGAQLRQVLVAFPRSQVLVLQYETCLDDPAGQLATTYRFLGLDDNLRPAGLLRAVRPRPMTAPTLDREARERMVGLYAADVAELVSMVPELDLRQWPHFAPG